MEVRKYELYLEEEKNWATKEYYMSCSDEVSKFGRDELKMDKWDREKLVVLALTAKGEMIGYHIASIGELSRAIIHPREIAKFLMLSNSESTIILHNHPSGDVTPSREDIRTTKRLQEVMELIGINFLDHIIIGRNGYQSLNSAGYIER